MKKFGAIGILAEKMISVRFSNLEDAWNQMIEAFGSAWFPLINSILDSFVPMLQFFTKGGIMESMGKAFADAFGAIYEALGGEKGLQTALAYLIAGFEVLPSIIQRVGLAAIQIFNGIVSAGVQMFNVFAGASTMFVNTFRPLINGGLKMIGLPGIGDKNVEFHAVKTPADIANRFLSLMSGTNVNLPKRANEILAGFHAFTRKDSLQDPKSFPFLNDKAHPYNKHLEKISTHTGEMVQMQRENMKQYALGGGDRGRNGISVSELHTRSRAVKVQVDAGGSKLNEALGEIFSDFVMQAQREGVLSSR
jgi:hypothetical protein